MAIAVQAGFIIGALGMSISGISDSLSSRVVFAFSALGGALFTAILVMLPAGFGSLAVVLRFLTGVSLAGVYSAGLKAMAARFGRRRGIAMGALVAALVLGSALPHLLTGPDQGWQATLLITAVLSIVGAVIMLRLVPPRPYTSSSPGFSMAHLRRLLRNRRYLLTVGGYLGHMWELYAFWAWVGMYLAMFATRNELSTTWVLVATFAVIAVGALGAIVAGAVSGVIGRELVVIVALSVSGTCALFSPLVFGASEWLVLLVLMIWGFFVVADSAQLSALATEVTNPKDCGTALALQLALGFAITLITISGSEWIAEQIGWNRSFLWLALGPCVGIVCMLVLRSRRPTLSSSRPT